MRLGGRNLGRRSARSALSIFTLVALAGGSPALAEHVSHGPLAAGTQADEPAAALRKRSGKLAFKIKLDVSPDIPEGTQLVVNINVGLISGPPFYYGNVGYANEAAVGGMATVVGGKASLSIALYYTFYAESSDTMIGVNTVIRPWDGNVYLPQESTLGRAIALPPDGATTLINFAGAI